MPDPQHPTPLPEHWSSEQALAVYQFLHQLTEQLWQRYGGQIVDAIRPPPPLDQRPRERPPAHRCQRHHDDLDIPF